MTRDGEIFEDKLKQELHTIHTTEITRDPIKAGEYEIWMEIDRVRCHIRLNLIENLPELGGSIPTGRFPYSPIL